MLLTKYAGVIAGLSLAVSAISTITIKGSKFFTQDDGNQWFVKGMSTRCSR